MSRIFITMGSAYSKATNVNPVDGIWCSDCGWAGRVEEDMTDSEESVLYIGMSHTGIVARMSRL